MACPFSDSTRSPAAATCSLAAGGSERSQGLRSSGPATHSLVRVSVHPPTCPPSICSPVHSSAVHLSIRQPASQPPAHPPARLCSHPSVCPSVHPSPLWNRRAVGDAALRCERCAAPRASSPLRTHWNVNRRERPGVWGSFCPIKNSAAEDTPLCRRGSRRCAWASRTE